MNIEEEVDILTRGVDSNEISLNRAREVMIEIYNRSSYITPDFSELGKKIEKKYNKYFKEREIVINILCKVNEDLNKESTSSKIYQDCFENFDIVSIYSDIFNKKIKILYETFNKETLIKELYGIE